ncbi:UDP-3-O-(3-hydroxymyristoyl)glucosamine N-acyltransferase [Palleronia sp. LCG004]|uniref:UDP-3-O-(3-hydroxymyristoyl)glucosamine N-acyltransferase n=1 Tax=Palleronia sp. LCG004 TaxID=3079304 RepID=UPI002942E62E|nr:UDP-3-O-(3-hydroxymyristoyl)glucosamine N-acyltransferase [Palleronia sp. LCG004]WOI56750.1 UDP-3-O-(3-hydroxymyristoyl)glucosamine N-acyltransferase [Palleronia sp. LCG004]
MPLTLGDIAKGLNGRLMGDPDLPITGAAEPADAGPMDLALAMSPKYADRLGEGRARAAILWEGADWRALGLDGALHVQRPRLAMAHLSAMIDPGPEIAPGIHPTAIVDPGAEIGADPAIGPFVVIGRGAKIGDRARIVAHCTVGPDAQLGDDALLHPNVTIQHGVVIGHRFIAQPGAVIGGDGLSFVTPEASGVEKARASLVDQGEIVDQSWTRIHSLGTVVIGDDVEVGANTTIDRGTIRATRIGNGCKLDNLVQIAHNVVMGRDCLAAALTGIAGSTVIGDRCVFGGNTGVADNILIGDDVILTGGTKVVSNVPAGRVMMGYPAVRLDQHVDIYKALRRLPRFMRRFAAEQK